VICLDDTDHTRRLIKPDIDFEEVQLELLPPCHQTLKGEMAWIILTSPWQAGRPMNSKDMANIVVEERGLRQVNLRIRNTVEKRVGGTLRHLRIKGLTGTEKGSEGCLERRLK